MNSQQIQEVTLAILFTLGFTMLICLACLGKAYLFIDFFRAILHP